MDIYYPLELASLIEEWMLHKGFQGIYKYDDLHLSLLKITWTDIICKSDPSVKIMEKKETCVLARMKSPLLVGEPEIKVQLYSGLIRYGNTDFNQKVNLPFDGLPDHILNYLSIKSLDIDLGSEVAQTEPSPYLFNPKPSEEGAAVAGPVWRGRYVGIFSLRADLSGNVKFVKDDGTVQAEDFREIVRFLRLSNKTNNIRVKPESCEWEVTGMCEFSMYS